MGYQYGSGGRNGNRQGGRSQSGGYNRGSGNGNNRNRGNNRGGGNGNADYKYVRSSYLSKHLIFEAEAKEGEKAPREERGIEPGVTEEVRIVLKKENTEMLLQKIEEAQNDPQGDGGIVLTAYLQHKINPNDNSEFDGASILIVGKFPPRGGNGFSGNSSRGNGNGGGRRDYPDRQTGDDRSQTTSSGNGGTGPANRGSEDGNASGYTESPRW